MREEWIMSQLERSKLPPSKGQAGSDPRSVPLDRIDVSDSELFETDTHWGYFERLRREDPVHYCARSDFGPYWSVTRYDDVVDVEKDPEIFSSARSIVVGDPDPDFPLEAGFITMDGERHNAHRKVVQPVASPRNLRVLEPLIRAARGRDPREPAGRRDLRLGRSRLDRADDGHARDALRLPLRASAASSRSGRTWRPRARSWSDRIWRRRANARRPCENASRSSSSSGRSARARRRRTASTSSLPSRTPPPRATSSPLEYLGTLVLLIVGGNDTTRNSISGGVLALNENPDEYQKLRERPDLIPNMVSEIIRWQTPLAHMRRTATRDTELAGKPIRKGDKVVMWYVSANRDEGVFEAPNDFRIERENARQHLSFGLGVHFCMGSRLAEMQLRVVWEETLRRFREVEVVGAPVRVRSNFVKGYSRLPVRVHPW